MSAQNIAAKKVEAVLGHDDRKLATQTDISNPDRDGGRYADPSGATMKALVWMGKNDVRVGEYYFPPSTMPPPTFPPQRRSASPRSSSLATSWSA